jgi:hypothetical protein
MTSSIISPLLFILIIFYFIVIFLILNINNIPLYIFYDLKNNKAIYIIIYFSNYYLLLSLKRSNSFIKPSYIS